MAARADQPFYWSLDTNIGSPSNPVWFTIGSATHTTGQDHVNSGATVFHGVLHGNGNTIYVDIQCNDNNAVVGFISVLGPGSRIANVTLRGTIQGRHIVGGLVGWNNGGHVHNNDLSDLVVTARPGSDPQSMAIGWAVGVANGGEINVGSIVAPTSNPQSLGHLGHTIGGIWPASLALDAPLELEGFFLDLEWKEPDDNDPTPKEMAEDDPPLPDEDDGSGYDGLIEDLFDLNEDGELVYVGE